MECAEQSELSGHGAVSPKPGYHRTYDEEYEAVSEASIQIVNPQHETAEGLVRDPDRLTEPVWTCRNNGMSVDVSPSQSMRRAPWGKAGHLWVHGLLIGTSEPTHSRRSVADRLTLRSRVMAVCGGGDPVVVRGRESRPHGEGDQVPGSFATNEE